MSNDRPFDLKFNAQSKNNLLGNYSKIINSKFSIETPFTGNESSTSTLINKLKINPDKNRSKKVSRAEMDSTLNIISEILVKVNNNRMRLDTLEGNVDFKIQSLITEFKDEAKGEINELQYEVRDDIAKIHSRLGEFERLNFRINKKVLDKPYKYTNEVKEALEREQNEIKLLINKKHDMLLSRIVEIKNWKEVLDSEGVTPFNSKIEENDIKKQIQIDLENSRVTILQEDLESIREKSNREIDQVRQTINQMERKIEDYIEKLDYQVYEFKSHTLQDLNNTTKEFQNFDREMKRYKEIFRLIESQNAESQNKGASTIDTSSLGQIQKEYKSRISNISPLSKHKVKGKSTDRYKLSKSVLGNPNIKDKSLDAYDEVDSDFEEDINKTELPKIGKSNNYILFLISLKFTEFRTL